MPSLAQWEQDTAGDSIGKGYVGTHPFGTMYAFQNAERMQPRTRRVKTLAGGGSPLKVVKSLGGLLVLLRGLERTQDCGLAGSSSS